MLLIHKVLRLGAGLAPVLVRRAVTVELDWDLRQKSRFEARDSLGRALGVFLPRGSLVRGGDVLVVEDGSLVRVIAAPQAVLQVRACPQHGSPFDLLRAAYHLGNRHVPLELQPDLLQLEPDHVLAEMLQAMHLVVTEAQAPFEPEAGAYAAGGHGHSHGPAQDPAHAPGHAHKHDHSHDHPHDHGHDHDHAHDHGAGHDDHARGPAHHKPTH